MKIFVADEVSESGLQPLRDAGFSINKKTGLSGSELTNAMADCAGLVVRSETKVTADVLDNVPSLKVVGRAGVGVDNIDVPAATSRGVVVMNAPDGNTITTAEHTIALLVALARRVPQANSSLKSGRWDRKSFIGVELQNKTLGIVGMGRIGRAVAARARAFGMRIVAFDPFIAPEQARDAEVKLTSLDDVLTEADFITVHTPLTADTRALIDEKAFAKMKRGVRIINCARGGLIDEKALLTAIESGVVAGAALDVFEQEPPASDHPLLTRDEVIVTPHLGASTTEAQEGVAFTVAEQMRDYLLTGALRGAVNVPALGAQELAMLAPYLELAEQLGRFHAQLLKGAIREVKFGFSNELSELNTAPIKRAFLAGLLRDVSARVNIVNAFFIADERNILLTTSRDAHARESIRTRVISDETNQTASGTLVEIGNAREGRITEIDGIHIETSAFGHLIVTHSKDVPGVIGRIGNCLGAHHINISSFNLGRRARGGEAIAVIRTDQPVTDAALFDLSLLSEVISATRIAL